MARIDPDPSDRGALGEDWYPDAIPDEQQAFGSSDDDDWVHARNRRRRARMRVVAALLVVLILFPIVITFVQRVLP